MDSNKKLTVLQNTYAASIAEAVNNYDRLKALGNIVEARKELQAQRAPYLNQQLGITCVEDVFERLSEIYGCANWTLEKTGAQYVATATLCKLCALSKKMGGANACYGWCLDPMKAMLAALEGTEIERISVESTLMDNDCCKVLIRVR